MKLVKSIVTTTFQDNQTIKERVEQWHYDTEEERNKHAKIMNNVGYSDSGQVRQNIGTLTDPKHVWFGSYFKLELL